MSPAARSASAFPAGATGRGAARSTRRGWRSAPSSRMPRAAVDDRDQRLVLFAAAPGELWPLVRRDARRLRLQRQGPALHHPHEAAARHRCADGELLRVGRAAPGPQARAGAVAVSAATSASSRRASSRFSRCCRSTPHRRSGLREQHDHRVERPHLARDRCDAPASPCGRGAPRELRRPRLHRAAAPVQRRLRRRRHDRPWPEKDDVSADFVYVRLHGSQALYQSAYTDAELDRWAARIAAWRAGRQAADARLIAPRRRRGAAARCLLLLRQHRQAAGPDRCEAADRAPRGARATAQRREPGGTNSRARPIDGSRRGRSVRRSSDGTAQSALCRTRVHVHPRIAEPAARVAGKRPARSFGR